MSNLNKAFKNLRKAGYFAKQNFTCCQTCGWSEVPDNIDNVVFYHAQDNEDKIKGNPFYLSWSGNGKEICKILNDSGVSTTWCGNDNKRILITKY